MTTPVVYLHGFASGATSSKARFFQERFGPSGRAIDVPDLVEGAFADVTLTGQLQVVDRVCAGRPVSLIGSSMGGYLAALYAAAHPEVDRLVLLAPAFDFAARWSRWLGEEAMLEWRRSGRLKVFHYGEKREAEVGYRLIEDASVYPPFPEVRQPVLILHGLKDDVVSVDSSREFVRRRPQTVLRTLDSGHQLLDVLEQVWTETERFLA